MSIMWMRKASADHHFIFPSRLTAYPAETFENGVCVCVCVCMCLFVRPYVQARSNPGSWFHTAPTSFMVITNTFTTKSSHKGPNLNAIEQRHIEMLVYANDSIIFYKESFVRRQTV